MSARTQKPASAAVIGMMLAAVPVGPRAAAEGPGLRIENGDVFYQDAGGARRLTRDGHNADATASRDGALIAYVHHDGGGNDYETTNSLHVCDVRTLACRELVAPRADDDPRENLTGIANPRFSYQAGIGPDGTETGSIFFETDAWATSGAVHRVTLGRNSVVVFVTDSNGFSIVPSGALAGALVVSQHRYHPYGCQHKAIMDPNTGKELRVLPNSEC